MNEFECSDTASREEVAAFYRHVEHRREQIRTVIECLVIIATVLAVALMVSLIGDH